MNSDRLSPEKILLLFGLLVFGIIVAYNAWFIPEVPTETKHSGSLLSKKDVEKSEKSGIAGGKINLNTATREELIEFIPGVGEQIADRIISYRETQGGFKNIKEIMEIKGIGQKLFEKIKDFITV